MSEEETVAEITDTQNQNPKGFTPIDMVWIGVGLLMFIVVFLMTQNLLASSNLQKKR